MLDLKYFSAQILVTCLVFTNTDGARYLLLPFNSNSHILFFSKIAKELIGLGHEVDMILPSKKNVPEVNDNPNFKVITYALKETVASYPSPEDNNHEWLDMFGTSRAWMVPLARWFVHTTMPLCVNVLSDQQLFKHLQEREYDLSLVDGLTVCRCFYVLTYRLGIHNIAITTQYDPWAMRVPALPSFVPFPMATAYTEKMAFSERLYNLYVLLDWWFWPGGENIDDELVTTYAPEKKFVSMDYLLRNSLLWLVNTDDTIDYARPTMPNIINIGGLTTDPGKPLPPDYLTFITGARYGVIYVSFGTYAVTLPNYMLVILLETFRQLKQKVIWKYDKTKLQNIPVNVKCESWVPQNDILAHPTTVMFIGHGGNNGQFEALYHGVPMINIPLFADQMYNAKRMDYKGYGKLIWLPDLTPEKLLSNVNLILRDASYKTRIRQGSQIFRSAPMTPVKRSVYWIEHVREFGADHLKSYALQMPWYQYWMVDIFAFLLIVFMMTSVAILIVLKFITLICCTRKQKSKCD